MGALSHAFGGLWKPLALGLLLVIGLGLMSDDAGKGFGAVGSSDCTNLTNNPELNRKICQYHPARIWNMPVTELLPFLAPSDAETAALD